jgi:hypothetical protein
VGGGWKENGNNGNESGRAMSSDRFKQPDNNNIEYNTSQNAFAQKRKSAAHHQMFDSS